MPKVAYDIGAVLKQVSLKNIPRTIYSLLIKIKLTSANILEGGAQMNTSTKRKN